MALQTLRAFYIAAQMGSLTKAADALDCSQPTLSRQIRSLERELGMSLMDHGRRPLRLTPAGELLLDWTKQLLEGIEGLESESSPAILQTTIRVVSTPLRALQFLPAAIARFLQVSPRSRIVVLQCRPLEALTMIQEGEADLGLLPDPEVAGTFQFRHLYSIQTALVAPKGHPLLTRKPLSIEAIMEYPLILLKGAHPSRVHIDWTLAGANTRFKPVVEVDGTAIIPKLVELGVGVSLAPEIGFSDDVRERLDIVPLANLFPPHKGGVVTLNGRRMTPELEHFIECLSATIGQATAGAA